MYTPSTIVILTFYIMLPPTTHRQGLIYAAGKLVALYIYLLQPWRGTASHLRSFQACTITRMQLEGRNLPCKQYCASGLQQHTIMQ